MLPVQTDQLHSLNTKAPSWTDHNLHDPGITLLEHLAYTISDLSYRLGFEVEDLIAEPAPTGERPFYPAREILTQGPMTIADYRKLLLDLPGVKNAWLVNLREPEAPAIHFLFVPPWTPDYKWRFDQTEWPVTYFGGEYEVLIEPNGELTYAEKQNILKTIHAHRNLCENINKVEFLDPEYIGIRVNVEVAENADLAALQEQVLRVLQRWISPRIPFYSLKDMLSQNKSPEELFRGPALRHGFIDDEELARFDKKKALRASDALHLLMDLPEVRLVQSMMLKADRQDELDEWQKDSGWEKQYLSLTDDLAPRLAYLDLKCYRRHRYLGFPPMHGTGLPPDTEVEDRTAVNYDLPVPAGKYRRPDRFFSITRDLPQNYGVGANGLPAKATDRRRAQAKQLKAYIALFEQLLAGYLMQLAHARDLFNLNYDGDRSYFNQPLCSADGIPDYVELLINDPKTHNFVLQMLTEQPGTSDDRLNRLLEHLLARFAERVSDPLGVPEEGLSPSDLSGQAVVQQRRFLRAYRELGKRRAAALDYTDGARLYDPENISGLEKRLQLLLDLQVPETFPHPSIGVEFYEEGGQGQNAPKYRFRLRESMSGKVLLSSWAVAGSLAAARHQLRWTIRQAAKAEGYAYRLTNDGRWYFEVIYPDGSVVARRIQYFKTPADCRAAAQELSLLMPLFPEEEYGYLLEHNLIRPREYLRPIFKREWEEKDIHSSDPWSFRLSFVFPGWIGRFAVEDPNEGTARRTIEELIDREVPAHLQPYIHWLEPAEMEVFETTWLQWRRKRAGGMDTKREENRLNEILGIAQPTWMFNGLELAGNNSYIDFAKGSIPIPKSTALTISFWAKVDLESASFPVYLMSAFSSGSTVRQLSIDLNQQGVSFLCGVQKGREDRLEVALPDTTFGSWRHWVFSKDQTNGRIAIYLDGSLLGEAKDKTLPLPDPAGLEQLIIGNKDPHRGLSCRLSEIRIWSEARSRKQINDQMNSRLLTGNWPADSPLYGYWQLREGPGATEIRDATVNGNHGAVYNAIWFDEE